MRSDSSPRDHRFTGFMGGRLPFVFVAAHGYSGSTLLSFLVGPHPEVVSVGEFIGPDVGGDRGAYVCSCDRRLRECPFWNRVAQRVNQDETIFRVESFDTAFCLSSNRLLRRLRTGSLHSLAAERPMIREVHVYGVAADLGEGSVPLLVDFRRNLRADELNSTLDQSIRITPVFWA